MAPLSLPSWSVLGQILLDTGASFAALALVFGLLERAFPARPEQPILRRGFATDLAYFLGQYLLWSALALLALQLLQRNIEALTPAAVRAAVAAQPLWLQAVEVLVLSDLTIYWGHRLQHRVPLLWRFHAVHHSAEHLDWLAAHREHPLDGMLTQLAVNAPALLLGATLVAVGPQVRAAPGRALPPVVQKAEQRSAARAPGATRPRDQRRAAAGPPGTLEFRGAGRGAALGTDC